MSFFFLLFFKLLPFYLYIFLGFLAGKFFRVRQETIASLLIYIITPVIVFNGAYTAPISAGTIFLPFLFFLLGSFFCLAVYQAIKHHWLDTSRNILAFAAGSGNTGYFGLPVAVAIFGEQAASIVILCIMGLVLYENSLGFFITARGNHTAKEALKKVFSLPSLYAFLLGLFFNFLNLKLGEIYLHSILVFRGAYTLLGMMMIGFGLSSINRLKFDFKFILVAFMVRFFLWPLAILFIITFDKLFFNAFTPPMRQVLILMSVVPLAANTVAYASALGAQPAKASVAVLASTLFALFYIPLVVGVFLGGK